MSQSVFTELYDRFREQLITARKAAGLTQTQLAAKLRQPQSFVSKYERGERRIDVIEFIEIADALSVDPVRLLRNAGAIKRPARKRRT